MNNIYSSGINKLNSNEKLGILIASAAVLVILTFIVISLIITFKKKSKKNKYVAENIRIYILDLENKSTTYFDKSKLNDVKTEPLFKFYDQFDPGSLKSVETWIQSLITNPDKTKGFLETHIRESKSNKTEFVLLEVTSVNFEKKLIHLESHFLPQLSTSSTRHTGQRYLLSFGVIQEKYDDLVRSNKKRGAGCLIRLFFKQNVLNTSTKYNLGALTIQAMNILSPYLKETRCACLTDINEILIFDINVANRSQFFSLANEIIKRINGYLTMNSINDDYGVCIGAAMFDPSLTNIKTFISHCRDMVSYAEKDEETSVALYEENSAKISLSSTIAYNELTSLIHNRTFRYYFTPMISYEDANIFAYMLDVVPYGTSFKDFDSVLKEASNANLLQSVQDIILKDYRKTAKGDAKVVIKVSVETLELLLKTANDTRNKNIVLVFDYEQIQALNDSKDKIDRMLKKIKIYGYSIGLYFEDVPSITIQSTILRQFDMFILGGNFANDLKRNKRVQADIILMAAVYTPYGKPIVINLKTMGSAEVAFAMGFKYFSCLEFANASSIFETLDDKQKKYIHSLNMKLSNRKNDKENSPRDL